MKVGLIRGFFIREDIMKKNIGLFFIFGMLCLFPSLGFCHFGMIISSDQMVMQGEPSTITLNLMFWHPFENVGMDLDKPAKFEVFLSEKSTSLLESLKPAKINNKQIWVSEYKISRPGAHIFYMIPQPYWEPAEDIYILHYTKVVVAAYGDDQGWDHEIGLETEIIPLSKPFGLYTGNVFQGIVKKNGKPVPYAEVEVEYYNKDGKYKAPTDFMICQTVKADSNGVFTYAAPVAGWWGFSALNTSDTKLKHDGQEKDVEIGAVIWVQFHDMK